MQDAGYEMGAENQRQYQNLWRSLWEMRAAGLDRILFYRTNEFDSFCKSYPKRSETSLIDLMVAWEIQYLPHIEQLEMRVARLRRNGDTKRKFYLDDPLVTNQLGIKAAAWNNASNQRADSAERRLFLQDGTSFISEEKSATRLGPASAASKDKSVFISMLPGHDGSVSVCSIIPLNKGDYLGVFAGEIRFSNVICPINGIRGPSMKL